MVKKVDKPIRLYVMTIFIAVAYGLFPLISVFPLGHGFLIVGPRFLPYNGSFQVLYGPDGEIPFFRLLVTLALSFFSVGSAVVTFLGVSEGRWATLLFLTLNLLWWFFLVVNAIASSDYGPDRLGLALQLLIPPFWLGFIWWNMTRPDITAWLRYQASMESQ